MVVVDAKTQMHAAACLVGSSRELSASSAQQSAGLRGQYCGGTTLFGCSGIAEKNILKQTCTQHTCWIMLTQHTSRSIHVINDTPEAQHNHKQTKTLTNKQTNNHTNNQTNKQTNKHININTHTNKQTNKQTNTQPNKRTNKHTNKPTHSWWEKKH